MIRRVCITLGLVLSLAIPVHAQTDRREKQDLTKTRPCGPDSIKGVFRYLLPQGFLGADFRPACRNHDDNYDTPNSNKRQADQQLRRETLAACESSRFKLGCRMMARTMYRLVDRYGDSAFQEAQRKAEDRHSLVPVLQSATATTKGGRVIECEIEVQTSPSRSIYLSWREKKKWLFGK
jgi:hypothetical protein